MCLPQSFSTLFFEMVSNLYMEFANLAKLANQQAPEICLALPPQHWDNIIGSCAGFYMGSGIELTEISPKPPSF